MAAGARFEPDSDAGKPALSHELPLIVIEGTMPVIGQGHKPVKVVTGQLLNISSRVFCLTGGPLAVIVRWRHVDSSDGESLYMHTLGDRVWNGQIRIEKPGLHVFCIDAWIDRYAGLCLALERAMHRGDSPEGLIEDALSQILQTLEFCDIERQQPLIQLYEQLAGLAGHEQIALLMDESTQVQMRDVQQRTCLVLSPEYPLYVTN